MGKEKNTIRVILYDIIKVILYSISKLIRNGGQYWCKNVKRYHTADTT